MVKRGNDSIEMVKTDLDIDEKIDAHRRGWNAQVWGFTFLFALVALAAAGVFGDGIASKTKESAQGITVESQRFYRFEARMEIKVSTTGAQSDDLTITFPNSYLQKFRVDSVLPEPESTTFDGDRVAYSFDGSGIYEVTFFLIPQSFGNIEGNVEVNSQSFNLKHFIYP